MRTMVAWAWSPILITTMAIIGLLSDWPVPSIAAVLGSLLVVGLVVAGITARDRQLETFLVKLRQLSGYFNRRFTGDSSISIFAIIDTLFSTDDPQLWDWARACDMSKRILNTWCDGLISRLESDTRSGRSSMSLNASVNELWLMNNHYFEFVEQFNEIATKIEIPVSTLDQYTRFATEYNIFVENFRDTIGELKKTAKTGIEPPSVKLAKLLPGAKRPKIKLDEEAYL